MERMKHLLPATQDARERYLRDDGLNTLVTAVRDSVVSENHYIKVGVEAFAGRPDLLYVALHYARDEGVEVMIDPTWLQSQEDADGILVVDALPEAQEDREVYLFENNYRSLVDAIRNIVASGRRVPLHIGVEAFAGRPDLLYVALHYARDEGVEVMIDPKWLDGQHHLKEDLRRAMRDTGI